MNYHNITKCDMNNGEGLRVVLWVAGCEHHCNGCHNPVTWDVNGGIRFDSTAMDEIRAELSQEWCDGITLSGGDPLHPQNIGMITSLCVALKSEFPGKTIWCYTGYSWDKIKDFDILSYIDVVIDGKFDIMMADINYHWAGSRNQRVIDVQKSLAERRIVLYDNSHSN